MNRHLFTFFLVPALFFAIFSANGFAQSTASNPEVSTADLALKLEPLTADDLKGEAEVWQMLVKKQIAATSDYLITHRSNSDTETLQDMRESGAALVARFSLVLDEWEQKGGDVTSHRLYVNGLPLFNLDTSDVGSFAPALTGWLLSSEGGMKWLRRILIFVGVLLLFRLLAEIIYRITKHAFATRKFASELIEGFIDNIIKRVVMLVGLITALAAIGVNVGAMVAVMGGGAFILGFAMQETLGNLASGFMLLINHPFGVGDAVEVAGVSGNVQGVRLMTTEIRTFDNKLILVPNSKIWGDTITNATSTDKRRVDLVFGIGYDDDVDRAKKILHSLVDRHPCVIDDPPPTIRLHELGESAVNFICRPWAKTEDYWTVYWDITRQVKDAFDMNGISFPYPTSDLRLHEMPKQSLEGEQANDSPVLLPIVHDEPESESQTEEGKNQKLEI